MDNRLVKIVTHFKDKKIGVIGDVILDEFVYGETERMSPEAPVPIVLFDHEAYMLGGAANTARNIRALGGIVFLAGGIGNDEQGKKILSELLKNSINSNGVFVLPDRPTTQKTRIVAKDRHVVRVDRESAVSIDEKTEESAMRYISDRMKEWDAVIVSDYGKGFITEKMAREIIHLADACKKLVIGDIKPSLHIPYFKGIGVLTPNTKEALDISQCGEIQEAGGKIQEEYGCNVLITRGPEGMTLFEGQKITHFPTLAKKVVDVAGAGDTVVTAFCLSLISGATMEEAAIIASHAASIAISKPGTAVVEFEELKESLTYAK